MQVKRMRLAAFAQAGRAPGDSPANKTELSVSEVKAYALREPASRRAYTVLEIRTNGGLTGYGECPAASSEALTLARQCVTGQAAPAYEVFSRQLAGYP